MDYDNCIGRRYIAVSKEAMTLSDEDIILQSSNSSLTFEMTQECIESYLQDKLAQGVATTAVAKYKSPLLKLYYWLPEDKHLTIMRLKEWRKSIEEQGYSKITVQGHVTVINDFLRAIGYSDLCIPKPLRLDLQGQTFGYLTAIAPTDKRNRRDIVWKCICKCGNEIEVPATLLASGNTTSCGCLNIEILKYANRYVEGTSLRQSLDDNPVSTRSASGYTGVVPKRDKWQAMITYKGKHYSLGTYTNIEDAIKARARAKELVMEDASKLYEEYQSEYQEKPARPEKPVKKISQLIETPSTPVKRSDNTSGCTGVTLKYGKWSANINYKGKGYTLGSYEKLDDAIAIRKQAEQYIKNGQLEQLEKISTNRAKH